MRATFILLIFSSSAMALDRPIDNAWLTPPPQSAQPAAQVWQSTIDTNDLLKAPKQLSFGVDIMTDSNGAQQITPYQKLNLTAEKSVSLSFEKHKPRIKFNAGGINTAVKLRGDGVKMQFNPTDKTIPLQVELKITDDESMMRFDYRF
ncbi:Uncharacterised protein [Aeromonas encheleia]|jgi:hypothetical protein|uniref:Uncharacterized protein n=1 Tax=Aeromonas encheleia TaxID=73010 RepID=A0AAE9ME25_9GAMM|nr:MULTISPECIES: hypothetical protein [Aeromonas]MBV7414659.1 hypothetical protein [Aeromonas sp. sif2433]MBV7435671.1 hypothetical protein [Aeromonas sp. sif2416]MBV7597525.1 hypothetical protein [Aeromonas sp. sia0103]UNP89336.1 hypothetical protein MNZ22_02415 [Aeromonas encheleia]USV56730.1 hypothetical protein NHF51_15450 [Aeromonas encheleia]